MGSQEGAYSRLFLAIPVTGMSGQYLHRLCKNLRPLFGEVQVSWTPLENLHLTLHYFGKVGGREYAVIETIVERLLLERPSFDLTFSEVVLFPRPSRPRLIVCDVDASDALERLVVDMRAEIERASMLVEPRPFRAHVTLGRLKQIPKGRKAADLVDRMRGNLEKVWRSLQQETGCSFTVDEITLYNSVTGSDGAVYEVVKRWCLQG